MGRGIRRPDPGKGSGGSGGLPLGGAGRIRADLSKGTGVRAGNRCEGLDGAGPDLVGAPGPWLQDLTSRFQAQSGKQKRVSTDPLVYSTDPVEIG